MSDQQHYLRYTTGSVGSLPLTVWDQLDADPITLLVERRRHIADKQADLAKEVRQLVARLEATRRELGDLDQAGKQIDGLLRINAALAKRKTTQPTTSSEETPAP